MERTAGQEKRHVAEEEKKQAWRNVHEHEAALISFAFCCKKFSYKKMPVCLNFHCVLTKVGL